MNERIRELEKLATKTVKCGLNGTSTAESFNRKKFAELIVRECAEVIAAQKPVWQNTDVPAEIALDMAAKNVKAYFGVKE